MKLIFTQNKIFFIFAKSKNFLRQFHRKIGFSTVHHADVRKDPLTSQLKCNDFVGSKVTNHPRFPFSFFYVFLSICFVFRIFMVHKITFMVQPALSEIENIYGVAYMYFQKVKKESWLSSKETKRINKCNPFLGYQTYKTFLLT